MTTCPACGVLVGDMDLHVGFQHGGTRPSGMCGTVSGVIITVGTPSPWCALPAGHFGRHRDADDTLQWGPDR